MHIHISVYNLGLELGTVKVSGLWSTIWTKQRRQRRQGMPNSSQIEQDKPKRAGGITSGESSKCPGVLRHLDVTDFSPTLSGDSS